MIVNPLCLCMFIWQKPEFQDSSAIVAVCLLCRRLSLNSSYAWKHLAFDSLEKGTTTCRDVRHLVSHAELVDASH